MHKEIASKTLTGQLLELGTDTTSSESVRRQVFTVMETLSREFRNDPSLRQVEDTFNRLKISDPSIIPPDLPQKHQITEEDRRREEEDLKRVLALSLEESQEDPRYYTPPANTSAFTPLTPTQASQSNNAFQSSSQQQQPQQPTSNVFQQQSQQASASQPQQQPQPQKDLLSDDITGPPQPATGKTASTVNRVRALYDLVTQEPDELTFHRGDIITVIESVYRDWWKGSLNGSVGIFPLNYVTPISESTAQDLGQEARDEQAIYSEAKNIEKILALLTAAENENPRPKIAENEQLQNLYNSTQAVRPKLIKLIERLTQRREDLIDLDKKFMKARQSYDTLIEASLPHAAQNQPTFGSANPFNNMQSNHSPVQNQTTGLASNSPAQPSGATLNTPRPDQNFPPGYNNASLQNTPTGFGFQGMTPNQTGNSRPQSHGQGQSPGQGHSNISGGQQGYGTQPPSQDNTPPNFSHNQGQGFPTGNQPQNQWQTSHHTGPQGNSGYPGSYPQQQQQQQQQQTGPNQGGRVNQSGSASGPGGAYPGQYGQGPAGGQGAQGRPQSQQQQPPNYGGFSEVPQSHNAMQNPQQHGSYGFSDGSSSPPFIIPAGTGMDDATFPPSNNSRPNSHSRPNSYQR